MDPELTKQLQQTLAALLANVQDAAAWTKGQIPALVQEKIAFGRVNETVQFLLCAATLWFAIWVTRRCVALLEDCGEELGWLIGTGVGGLGTIVSIFATALQCQAMLMAWFAPRLYIVEWLMSEVHK